MQAMHASWNHHAVSLLLLPACWLPARCRENQVEDVLGGYTIPAKTTIMVSISFLHADPRAWGDDVNEFR